MPPPNDPLQVYYAARAAEYDHVYAKPERQPDLREIERWLPRVFAGLCVLEVACGTGYWTQFIAPGARELVAVDASGEVLRLARARVAPSRSTSFVLGDAYRLPVAAGGFGAAFAGFWFSHVPRARVGEFLAGLHRVLAPGSIVVLLDNRYVDGSSTPIAERDEAGNTYQVRSLRDGSTHKVLKNFPSKSDLLDAVYPAASQIRFYEWRYFWALEYVYALRPI
jgi:ubiquinone/menaquinone biosynthesis C-methylase UbiE